MTETRLAALPTVPLPLRRAGLDPAAVAFAMEVVGAAARLPGLADPSRPAVDRLDDRRGVTTLVLATPDLRPDELTALLTFRLAQFLASGAVEPSMVHAGGFRHDPPASVGPADLHVVALAAATGELLAYATLRAMPDVAEGITLRTPGRPPLPKEAVYGRDLFNRLRILPDLPMRRLREIGRTARDWRRPPNDELGVRAPSELFVAVMRALAGPLRGEVDAVVGDVEIGVSDHMLTFLHLPAVLLRGVLARVADDTWLARRYLESRCHPFAMLLADDNPATRARLAAVEAALALPWPEAGRALFALLDDCRLTPSSLQPDDGSDALMQLELPSAGLSAADRAALLARGEWLRSLPPFAALTVAEATTLARLMAPIWQQYLAPIPEVAAALPPDPERP
jgi:hypothetical protein